MANKKISDQQFAESKHQYTHPFTKERLIGVTTVVGCYDGGDKLGAGAGAAAKLIRAGIDYRARWNAQRDLGSRVHGYAHLWMDGKTAEVPDSDGPYLDAFAQFCRDHTPEWLTVEAPVVSSLGYGGRFDMIGEWDGSFVLADIKTGKPYKTELTLQLSGYRYADGIILYDEEGNAVDLDPLPHIDRCAGLYLHDDGTYDLVYCDVNDESFAAFKALLSVKKWAKQTEKAERDAGKVTA